MFPKNKYYILPNCQPVDYQALTDDQLQGEITYCLDTLEIFHEGFSLINSKNIAFYKARIKFAEDELERRFLLS